MYALWGERIEGRELKRHQPLRRIHYTVLPPMPNPPGSVGVALGGQAHQLLDHLSCGHVLVAKLLMSPSRSPYVYSKVSDERFRRCPYCPRVAEGDVENDLRRGES